VANDNEKRVLTTGQAAKLLGASISSIIRATNEGKIKFTRYGNKPNGWRRIAIEDLEKYAGRKLTRVGAS
jgi:excisionase family DNA binding protein